MAMGNWSNHGDGNGATGATAIDRISIDCNGAIVCNGATARMGQQEEQLQLQGGTGALGQEQQNSLATGQ
jgi:hypothetical protein